MTAAQFTIDRLYTKDLWVNGAQINHPSLAALLTNHPSNNVGISTNEPTVKLDINGTDALRLPAGNKISAASGGDRPADADANYCIRYNTDDNIFEGYSNGNWGSLGGVTSINQKVTITADNTDGLKFLTGPDGGSSLERMRILNDGNVGIGESSPKTKLHISNGHINIEGDANSGDSPKGVFFKNGGVARTFYISGESGGANTSVRHLYLGYSDTLPENFSDSTFTSGAKMVIRGDGNVGIGTTTPTAALSVVGGRKDGSHPVGCHLGQASSRAFLELCHGTGAQIDFATGDGSNDYGGRIDYRHDNNKMSFGTNGTGGHMTIDSAGYVGIGTDSPSNTLTINGSNDRNNTNAVPILGLRSGNVNDEFNDGAQIAFGYNGLAEYQHFIHTRHNALDSNNAIDFYVCDGTSSNTVTSGSIHTMSLVSGNVGIGTDSPIELLNINKGINTDSEGKIVSFPLRVNNSSMHISDNVGGGVGIKFAMYSNSNDEHRWAGIAGISEANYSEKTALAFYTHDGTPQPNEQMRIDSGGNVGIGTDSPSYKLDVNGTARVTGQFDIYGGTRFTIFNFGTDNDAYIRSGESTGKIILQDGGGNVGIGTTSPIDLLTVGNNATTNSGGTTSMSILGPGEDSNAILYFGTQQNSDENSAKKAAIIAEGQTNWSTSKLHFCLNNYTSTNGNGNTYNASLTDSRMTIQANGNVGIGTASPTGKLDIYNPVNITGVKGQTGTNNLDQFSIVFSPTPGSKTDTGYLNFRQGMAWTDKQSDGAKFGITCDVGTNNSLELWGINDRKVSISARDSNTSTPWDTPTLTCWKDKVGIGTDSPETNLQVQGGFHVKETSDDWPVMNSCGKGLFFRFYGNPENRGYIQCIDRSNSDTQYELQYNALFHRFATRTNNTDYTRMIIQENGNVGIGMDDPDSALDVKTTTAYRGIFLRDENGLIAKIARGTDASKPYMSMYTNSGGTSTVSINGNGTTWFNGGRVGIGTDSPRAGLEVTTTAATNGNAGIQDDTVSYLSVGYTSAGETAASHDFNSTNYQVSIIGSGLIYASAYVGASDTRIKKNIVEINDEEALQKLRDISCCWYEYIDKVKRYRGKTLGFIAQQVKTHLPEAVSIMNDFLPDEMKQIHTSWNETKMSSNDLQDVSGVKYKFYVGNDISGNDETEKEIIGNANNTFTFDASYNYVFCYGKEVDDFHTLDKQKLFALNFSATQEIDKIQQEEKIKLTTAETKLAAAETKLAAAETEITTLKDKVTSLETTIADLVSRITALETA